MNTVEDFKNYVASVEAKSGYKKPLAFALGVKRSKGGKTLDTYFPQVNWNTAFGSAAVFADIANIEFGKNKEYVLDIENLNDIYNKFSAFHHEIEKHSNIIAIKNLLESYSNDHSYYQSDLVVYFMFEKDTEVETATEGYFKLVPGKFGDFYSCTSGVVCTSKPRVCDKCGSPSSDTLTKSVCHNETCREETVICDRCGRPMKLRQSQYGNFYGCSGYGIKSDPCKQTRQL